MKNNKALCASIAALMLIILAGCNQDQSANNQKQKTTNREITGTVYIMTAGAETIRLPMVQIVAFDIATNDAKQIINTERQAAEQKLDEDGKSLVGDYALANLNRLGIQIERESSNVDTNKMDNLFEAAKTNLTVAIGEWGKWQNEIQPAYYGNNAYEKMGKPVPISITDVDGKFDAQIKQADTLLAATTQRQTPAGTETYFWLIPIPAGNEKVNMELNNKTLLEYSSEAQLMIQKTTADASKMRNEIQAWLSEASSR